MPVFRPLLNHARHLGAHGGRGSGKSYFFADKLIARCFLKPRTRWVCLREIQQSLKQSVKLLIQDEIEKFGLSSYFGVFEDHIKTPGDGVIIFQGMQNHTADSVKSLNDYDGAWFEEAHKASKFSIGILTPTIRSEDSELWWSWNPISPKDPIEQLLRIDGKDKTEDAIVVEANYRDNLRFPGVLRAEMERDRLRDPERYAHVWLGKYQSQSEAVVFRNWRVDEFETPSNARFYFGADWGFAIDPTVLVRCWIKGRTLYIDHEAVKVGCDIDKTPELFDKIPGARQWRIRADSSNPQAISYMQRHGYPKIVPAIKGPNSVQEGVEFLKSFDIVIHPRCPVTADEFATYAFEVDKRTEEVLPKLADKKNHVIDSARYAVEDLRRAPPVAQFGTYQVVR